MYKKAPFYLIVAALLAIGLYFGLARTDIGNRNSDVAGETQVSEVSYQGEDGKTALELLKAKYEVEVKSFDFGDMVVGINGRVATGNEFWAFYVNGELAQVGAGDYQTKDSDNITWRLETF